MDKAEGLVKVYGHDVVGKDFEFDFFNAGIARARETSIQ